MFATSPVHILVLGILLQSCILEARYPEDDEEDKVSAQLSAPEIRLALSTSTTPADLLLFGILQGFAGNDFNLTAIGKARAVIKDSESVAIFKEVKLPGLKKRFRLRTVIEKAWIKLRSEDKEGKVANLKNYLHAFRALYIDCLRKGLKTLKKDHMDAPFSERPSVLALRDRDGVLFAELIEAGHQVVQCDYLMGVVSNTIQGASFLAKKIHSAAALTKGHQEQGRNVSSRDGFEYAFRSIPLELEKGLREAAPVFGKLLDGEAIADTDVNRQSLLLARDQAVGFLLKTLINSKSFDPMCLFKTFPPHDGTIFIPAARECLPSVFREMRLVVEKNLKKFTRKVNKKHRRRIYGRTNLKTKLAEALSSPMTTDSSTAFHIAAISCGRSSPVWKEMMELEKYLSGSETRVETLLDKHGNSPLDYDGQTVDMDDPGLMAAASRRFGSAVLEASALVESDARSGTFGIQAKTHRRLSAANKTSRFQKAINAAKNKWSDFSLKVDKATAQSEVAPDDAEKGAPSATTEGDASVLPEGGPSAAQGSVKEEREQAVEDGQNKAAQSSVQDDHDIIQRLSGCDFDEYDEKFFDSIPMLVALNRPFVMRGLAHAHKWGARVAKKLGRAAILKQFGELEVYADHIPYKKLFDGTMLESEHKWDSVDQALAQHRISMQEYVAGWENNTARLDTDDVPKYFFMPEKALDKQTKPFVSWWAKLLGAEVQDVQPYLGPAFSGAPFHWHQTAVNFLAHGKKLWLITQPQDTHYGAAASKTVVKQMLGDIIADAGPIGVQRCVQEAGDVLFVPADYGHATLNLQPSAGVAFEFESCDWSAFRFCMR